MEVNHVNSGYLGSQYNTDYTTAKDMASTENIAMQNNSEILTEEQIQNTIKDVNKLLEKVEIGIQYERHEATNRMMIRLVNKENNEVVKEIPSEKILDLAAFMCEQAGLFVDERL